MGIDVLAGKTSTRSVIAVAEVHVRTSTDPTAGSLVGWWIVDDYGFSSVVLKNTGDAKTRALFASAVGPDPNWYGAFLVRTLPRELVLAPCQ